MPKRNGWRLAAALGLLIALVGAALAAYDAIWPRQSGTNVLTSKSLVVDASNASQGYIMARGDAGNKRLKLRVTQGRYKLTYDLNTSGDYEVFPLQLGDGSYTVELFENVSGKKYSAEGKVSVNVKLDDPYAPFLGPNQYVNYTPDTEAVQTSYELCAGMTDPQEIFETVRRISKPIICMITLRRRRSRAARCRISTAAMNPRWASVRIWPRWRPACCACREFRRG